MSDVVFFTARDDAAHIVIFILVFLEERIIFLIVDIDVDVIDIAEFVIAGFIVKARFFLGFRRFLFALGGIEGDLGHRLWRRFRRFSFIFPSRAAGFQKRFRDEFMVAFRAMRRFLVEVVKARATLRAVAFDSKLGFDHFCCFLI